MMTKICVYPSEVVFNGPIQSQLNFFMSPYDAVVNGFVCIGTLILDIFWHKGQPRIKAITFERMLSHMLLKRLNLVIVHSTPRISM